DAASRRAAVLAAKLHTDFPAYAGLADPGPASLEALRSALRPREAFAAFVVGSRSGYVLLATKDGLTARALETNSDDLASDVADLRAASVPQLGRPPEFSLA